jgi:TetR/AcrR family transcriptional repressor of nem operon
MAGRPKEFDRDEVIARAVDVFWRSGYEATSLEDLTGAMGIGRGSLYNEFGDKHSLFVESLDRYRRERLADLERAIASTPSARAGIEAVLRRHVEALWSDPGRRGCLLVNSTAELASSDPEIAARGLQGFERFADAFRSALERGQREGEIGEGIDVPATARYLASTLVALRVLAKVSDRGTAEDVVEVTLKALGAP